VDEFLDEALAPALAGMEPGTRAEREEVRV
jgi:hypothetical protein